MVVFCVVVTKLFLYKENLNFSRMLRMMCHKEKEFIHGHDEDDDCADVRRRAMLEETKF